LLIIVNCAMIMLRVSAWSAWRLGSEAPGGRLSGVDMVIGASVLEADTKLLRTW
jgi:hypothetical protein